MDDTLRQLQQGQAVGRSFERSVADRTKSPRFSALQRGLADCCCVVCAVCSCSVANDEIDTAKQQMFDSQTNAFSNWRERLQQQMQVSNETASSCGAPYFTTSGTESYGHAFCFSACATVAQMTMQADMTNQQEAQELIEAEQDLQNFMPAHRA